MSGTSADTAAPWVQHLRLAILRSMLDSPGRAGHESLIVDLVNAVMIYADREQVRDQLVWLNEQELVVAEIKGGSIVAVLTEAGAWVAEGKRDHAGVKRPNVTAGVARKAMSIALDQLKR